MKPTVSELRPQIAVLPDAIVDQIAAGEVVERPASVVKELVENALDAFATEIEVEVKKGGTEEIRVVDNGIGMDREGVLLALKRHATSKIRSMDDLAQVATLGFRGEALPSIASVARLEIVTRALSGEEGILVRIAGGRIQSVENVGAQVGTTIIVRDLFYNVPARRKFLKTAATESRRVATWMTDLALGYPAAGFRYRSEGRTVFNSPPHEDALSRIGDVLGTGVARALLPVDNQLDYVGVRGYVGRPDLAKRQRGKTFIYVNGRRIQDRSLMHALTAGYGEYLADGRFPVAVIFLSLPAETVDVNVHPTKAEVRFLHPRLVYDALYYTVNRVLLSTDTIPSFSGPSGDTNRSGHHQRSGGSAASGQMMPAAGLPAANAGFSFHDLYGPAGTGDSHTAQESPGEASPDPVPVSAGGQLERPDAAGGKFYQFAQLYIVAPVSDALIVVDQHAAHERILYEAVLDRVHADLTVTQNILFPISVELEPLAFEVFEANEDLLDRTGFQVRPFGHHTVLLEGAPAVLRGKAPDRYFREVLDMLGSELRAGRDRLTALAAAFACKAAIKAGDVLNESEMAALFDQLFATRQPYSCPHGRPTVIRIARSDFDRRFGRT